MSNWVDHALVAGAFLSVLVAYCVLELLGHGPQPKLLDLLIALGGGVVGFAMRRP